MRNGGPSHLIEIPPDVGRDLVRGRTVESQAGIVRKDTTGGFIIGYTGPLREGRGGITMGRRRS